MHKRGGLWGVLKGSAEKQTERSSTSLEADADVLYKQLFIWCHSHSIISAWGRPVIPVQLLQLRQEDILPAASLILQVVFHKPTTYSLDEEKH